MSHDRIPTFPRSVPRTDHLAVCAQQCDACLFTKDRLVSPERAGEIIGNAVRDGSYFECHRGSMRGDTVCCRAFWDKYKDISDNLQLAQRLDIMLGGDRIRFVDPDTGEAPKLRPGEAPNPEPEKLYTAEEVGRLVGKAKNTIRQYARDGLLVRANEGARGVKALYKESDVRAVVEAKARYHAERLQGSLIIDGKKQCSKCRQMLDVEQYTKNRSATNGLASWCKECERVSNSRWYYDNWERERAKRAAYKKAHPEKFRAYRRKAYHKDPAREYRWHRAWVERNRARYNERERQYNQQNTALSWGLTSPITRRQGFALVVSADQTWRAARLDVPFAPGERAVVRFLPPMSKGGRWAIHPWAVLSPGLRSEADRLVARCSKAKFIIGKAFKKGTQTTK